MKQPKKQLVKRTHDNGTKTAAGFFADIRSMLRKKFMYSAIRKAVVKRQRVAPNAYLCEHCKKIFKSEQIEVNHKDPCGSLRSFADLSTFAAKLFNEDLNAYEVLCKPCHHKFTHE
jgi:5-methylcytosine-specific restriction endonuclease McrA